MVNKVFTPYSWTCKIHIYKIKKILYTHVPAHNVQNKYLKINLTMCKLGTDFSCIFPVHFTLFSCSKTEELYQALEKFKRCFWGFFAQLSMPNINFLLIISIHNQENTLWEITKWSPKGKCFWSFIEFS